MKFRELVDRMLGRSTPVIPPAKEVELGREDGRLAGRLSVLSGKRRDDVLAEAYRRSDQILTRKRP